MQADHPSTSPHWTSFSLRCYPSLSEVEWREAAVVIGDDNSLAPDPELETETGLAQSCRG